MSVIKLSGFLALAAIAAMQTSCPAQAQQWGNGYKWGAGANVQSRGSSLEETKLLYKNDDLVPTQNRTQAMRLEAESGHINPQVDAKLQPIIRKQRQQVPPYVVKKRALKQHNAKLVLHSH